MAQVKLTQSYVQSLKPDGKPHWIRDAVENKLVLYLGKSGAKTWYVDYTRPGGKRATHKIGPAPDIITVAMARDAAREFLARVALGEDPGKRKGGVLTLGVFLRDYYAPWVLENRRAGKWILDVLHHAFGFLMESSIESIGTLQLEQWRTRHRREQNQKAATMNRKTGALKAALNWGVKHKLLEVNPISGLEPLKEDDSEKKVRYLSEDERARLLASLDAREARIRSERSRYNKWLEERGKPLLPDLNETPFADYFKPMILIALNTGIRRNALFSLVWGDVDLRRKLLLLRAASAKSGKSGYVNLNKTALEVLESWKKQSPDTSPAALVFPSPKSGQKMDNCGSAWERLLKDAEIKNFRWHDMRHDFASRLVMAGVDLNTVRELLGHSDLKMTLRYAHLAPEAKQRAVEKLD